MRNDCVVVVPWHREEEIETFLKQWKCSRVPDWLILQQDVKHEGCGATKNKGITRAIHMRAEVVIVLDGDCYPAEMDSLPELVDAHLAALEPQQIKLFETVTNPPSRGTPYMEHHIEFPVAASMGFWTEIGDYCAVRQLAFAGQSMTYKKDPVYGHYFPLCGMNLAFNPNWLPWCRFIEVPRFDDIWMGWLWQREAYRRGYCFNLGGPMIRHARQSNVWQNLHEEEKYLKQNETLWKEIATSPSGDYESLRNLLPV